MGRKKAIIDWEGTVVPLLMSGAGATTISRALGVGEQTIYRACERDNKVSFEEYRRQNLALGTEALIKKGYQMAMKGDRTMLIFYLKNRAGYADRTITDNNISLPTAVEERVNKLLDNIEEAEESLKKL